MNLLIKQKEGKKERKKKKRKPMKIHTMIEDFPCHLHIRFLVRLQSCIDVIMCTDLSSLFFFFLSLITF